MKFLFICRDFHSLPIADRLQDDGFEVVLGMVEEEENPKTPKAKSEARLSLYDGILEKHSADDTLKWMRGIKNKDEWFCFFDYGDLWEYSEKALGMGFRVGIFPTEEGYKLEKDREFGKEFARKHFPNLKVAEVHEFKKIDDAIRFLEEQHDKIFVLKSEGSNAETVVPSTHDVDLGRRQIIGALQSEQKDYENGGFTLEELIQNPVEITPVLLCWNGKPLCTLLEFENKNIGSGNIGRLSGGCQNLTMLTGFDSPINRIAFPEVIYQMAKKSPGLSVFDAGLLFDGKNFCFTEFCAQRFGYDGFFSTVAMAGDSMGHENAGNFFKAIAAGHNPCRNKFGAAVRLFQSEPSGQHPDMYHAGCAIDWLDSVSDQLFLYCIEHKEVEGNPKGMFISSGYEKDLGTCTGTGNEVISAVENAYRCATGVAMNGLLYRPKFDYLSRDYFTSIPNRLEFVRRSGLVTEGATQG